MGRKKIKIQRIAEDRNRSVTYLKRKAGLMKKAHELAVLTDSDVAVIVFAKNGKLAEFCSTDIDQLLLRYTEHEGPVERRGPDFYFKQAAKDAASDDEDEDEDVKPAGPFDPTEPGPSGPRWGDGDGGSGPSAGGSGSGGPSGSSSADAGRSSSGTAEGKKRDYGGAPSSGRPSAGKKRAMGPSDGADATTPGDSSMPAGLVAAESTSPSSAFTGGLRMGRSISATGPVPLVERRKLRAALVQRHRTSDVGPSTQGSAYAQQHQLHHGAFYTSSSSAEFAMPDSRPPTAPAAQSYIGLHDEPMFGAHARHHTYPHHGQQQQQQQGTFSPPRFAYSTPDSLSSSGHPSSTSASVSAPETRPQTMAGGEVFHHPQQQSHSYMHLAVSGSGSHAHSHARASASLPGSLGGHWPTRDARPEGQQQQGQLNYPASAPLDAPYTSRAGTHMSGSSWEQARYAEQQQQQQHQQQLPHQAVLRQYPQYTAYARGLVQQEQERQMQQHQQPQMHSSGLAQQHSGSIEMQEQEQIDAGRARTLGHYEASRSAAAYRALHSPLEPYPSLAAPSGLGSMLAHGAAPPFYDASAGDTHAGRSDEKWSSQQHAQSGRSYSCTSSSSAAGGSDVAITPSSYHGSGEGAPTTSTTPGMSNAELDVLIGSVLSHTTASGPSPAAVARAAQIAALPASGMNKTPPSDVDAPPSSSYGYAVM